MDGWMIGRQDGIDGRIMKPAISQKFIKKKNAISHNWVEIPQPNLVSDKLNSDLQFKYTDTIKCEYLPTLFYKCSFCHFSRISKMERTGFIR